MKIALSSYSLRNEWDRLYRDKIDILIDVCNDLGITEVELLDQEVIKENLKDDLKKLADHGVKVFSFAPHTKILVRHVELKKNLDEGKIWLDLAHANGIKFLRFQVGDGSMPHLYPPMDDFDDEEWEEYNDQISEAIDFTSHMVDPLIKIAEDYDIKIGLETHHSYSSNYVYMKQFNQKWDSKYIGWIFDIGNYENDNLRWKALEEIKERVFYVHAKAYDFDADGFETTLDYPKASEILHNADFDGNWSIEFEGKMNGILGAYKSNELLKYCIAKSENKEYTINTNIPKADELMKKYQAK